jgi:hypothetical protein
MIPNGLLKVLDDMATWASSLRRNPFIVHLR